jgi:hypothetical protein
MSKQRQAELSDELIEYGNQIPSNLSDISFRFDERSKKSIGYGYTTKNEILVDNRTGKIYDPHEGKAVFLKDFYKCRTSRLYAVVPDEAIEEYSQPLIDSGELRLIEKQNIRHGLVTTWKYETKKNFQVKKSKDKDDIYGVQVVVKNSLNGNVALSASVRTLRQICGNGLTAWGSDFGARLIHYGDDLTEKLKGFRGGIYNTLGKLDNAIALWERTAEIQATQNHIQYILNKTEIAETYLPDYIQLEPKKRKIAAIGKEGKNKTLYEITNDFTWKLSRAEKSHPEHNKIKGELSFLSVTNKERQLNRAIHRIVVANGKVPQ